MLRSNLSTRPFYNERLVNLVMVLALVAGAALAVFSVTRLSTLWSQRATLAAKRDEAKATELEAYNQQLEILFHGDHCHNLDRIMRLPGTVNLPDAKSVRVLSSANFSGRKYSIRHTASAAWVL